MKVIVQSRWLVPFTGEPEGRCPKCLSKQVNTEHHTSTVSGMCQEQRDAVLLQADDPDTVPDELTEHLCRGCLNCYYTWSEHVAGPEDLEKARSTVSHAD